MAFSSQSPFVWLSRGLICLELNSAFFKVIFIILLHRSNGNAWDFLIDIFHRNEATTSVIYQPVLFFQFDFDEMKPSKVKRLKTNATTAENIENSLDQEIVVTFWNWTLYRNQSQNSEKTTMFSLHEWGEENVLFLQFLT